MRLSLSASRNGPPTCAVDGIWLHSPYEPEREARRFAESAIGSSRPTHVLLLGPCLDYLTPALRGILPSAAVIVLQYSPDFDGLGQGRPDASWNPLSPTSLDAFLDAAIDEDAVSGVSVIEWEPASRAFPAEALRVKQAVKLVLDRLTSSTATVKASGRRWISNACLSFLLAERVLEPRRGSFPILIAAAGPSLVESLSSLSGLKGRFATIAVSSALAACRHAGIEPDLVVSTDGGYWSRLHLYPFASGSFPLAAPITALPSASLYGKARLLLIDQGSFVESELLPALGPSLRVPPHVTVSGTALRLAARLTEGPIVAAGLDLASYGELDHARPHGFDQALSLGSSRTFPIEGTLWSRSLEGAPEALPEKPWRRSRAMGSYAAALAIDAASLPGRVFRLGPSPTSIPGMEAIDAAGLANLVPSRNFCVEEWLRESPAAPLPRREAALRERIAAWRDLAAEASASLARAILPEDAVVAELFRSIDIVDYAAARRAVLANGDPRPAARDLARRCELFLSSLARRFAP